MTVPTPAHDYERIAQAIAFIERNAQHQPSLDEIAASQHLSTYHFQRLFARWAGTTPKRYLQVLTVERAKSLLASGASALDASCDVGLSSSSRLHDHFVQLEAITPGQFKSGGANLVVRHAVHDTPFGAAFVASTEVSRSSALRPDSAIKPALQSLVARSAGLASLCSRIAVSTPFPSTRSRP